MKEVYYIKLYKMYQIYETFIISLIVKINIRIVR